MLAPTTAPTVDSGPELSDVDEDAPGGLGGPMGAISPSGHSDAQTLAVMLQEQLDAINEEIRFAGAGGRAGLPSWGPLEAASPGLGSAGNVCVCLPSLPGVAQSRGPEWGTRPGAGPGLPERQAIRWASQAAFPARTWQSVVLQPLH